MSTLDHDGATACESALIPTYVGRQPIFDQNLETRAYELLFRHGLDNWADFSDSDWATGQTFWNGFVELGVDQIADGQRSYVNVTPLFVKSECIRIFPKERLALELQAGPAADEDLVSRLAELRDEGFRIVIDDFDGSQAEAVTTLASELKIDWNEVGAEKATTLVAEARTRGQTCIAKNIETYEVFEACRKAGFAAFQGHFLARPQVVVGGRLPADGIGRMRLLAAVNDPEGGIEKLEEAIGQDVALSYKLLHYVNSALFALKSEVESIRHAVMILGLRWVRTWANLVILSGVKDRPQALFNLAVIRGKMCEQLARASNQPRPESFFTAGLLSALEALLARPMKEILDDLPLADDLRAALLEHNGVLGEALSCTLGYEQSAWGDLRFQGLDATAIRDSYLTALQWTAKLRGTLGD
ncbi:MAG: HDOD domain-containing protein [Planctomycetes bacterium]|nr:HDOD domain-containing protein [Planctomycetota bacterium]